MCRIRGIGDNFAAVLAREVFYRSFANRRQLASYMGITPMLDPEAAQDIMRLLTTLAHKGHAVLCVLHQVDLAFAFADRVVGMRDGRIAFDRISAEVSRDTVQRLYLAQAA